MVQERDDIVGARLRGHPQHPTVWEASGHVAGFTDPLVDCRNCKERFRADQLEDAQCRQACREAAGRGRRVRPHRGAPVQPDVQDARRPGGGRRRRRLPPPRDRAGHLRQLQERAGDRAQKPPFGIAQIGKSFRNEITPGNFIFRSREFEQMEMEFFVPPDRGREVVRVLGRAAPQLVPRPRHPRDNLRSAPHDADELSHYSSGTSDIEFLYPLGWRSSRASRTAATST